MKGKGSKETKGTKAKKNKKVEDKFIAKTKQRYLHRTDFD